MGAWSAATVSGAREGVQFMDKKILGILGGMGPAATADLFGKIVSLTKADSDRDHIRVIIDSNSAIPDRTAAILMGGEDPVPEMLSALRNLEKCGAECVIMPCNTAHRFLPQLQSMTRLPILDMPGIAAKRCAGLFPGKRAAILATKGTLAAGIYRDAMDRAGAPYLIPDAEEQDMLMYLIYDVVKASRPMFPEREKWETLLCGLRDRGAEVFILGCTELPLLADALAVPGPFIDPTEELARTAIEFCGYTVREA